MFARFKRLGPATVARVKALLFVASLLPFVRLLIGAIGSATQAWSYNLGANPLELITRSTGTWTIVFLCITLSITPLRKLTGMVWLAQLRRMFGLFVFFYVACHFTTYIWFDFFFDFAEIVADIPKRPFVTIGFAAFVLLIPLAATSNNRIIKAMGAKRWLTLHKAVYLIAVLAVVHYWWLVKRDLTQPIIYAVIVALLLGLRLWWWRKDRRQLT